MSKAANIYWDNSRSGGSAAKRPSITRNRRAGAKAARTSAPWWLSFLILTSIFGMLLVSINFRAFTAVREEVDLNSQLAGQIQNLMDENLALQEEIHLLKTDPNIIQREARRIGLGLQHEQVLVPSN